jgi:hypothetical protein
VAPVGLRGRERFAAVLLTFVFTGCGAHSNDESSAAPCLEKLGLYTSEGISADLHILGRDMHGVPPPVSLKRISDLSFRSPGAGANSAQIFVHDSAGAARGFARTWGRGLTRVYLESVVVFWTKPPSVENRRVLSAGSAVVFFSSRPTAGQRARVADCLA